MSKNFLFIAVTPKLPTCPVIVMFEPPFTFGSPQFHVCAFSVVAQSMQRRIEARVFIY